ncbi:hypothetical protein [Sphingobium fuliginis]|nr:hypothetical protein [Sphingobium fuliginis]RYL97618.1 hypothetical protein EWH10_13820 [Sphingobium fuliginis]
MTKVRIPFELIMLSGADIPAARKDVKDAVERGRFASSGWVRGDRESYGKALLGFSDFCRAPSGVLDDADVRFPKTTVPADAAELADRFRWMIYAPGNEEVITALINALRPIWESNPRRQKARRRSLKHTAIMPKPDPWSAAVAVFGIMANHPSFANFLMQGYLEKASRYIASRPAEEQASLWDIHNHVSIFWIYLKAQIRAARLFHAEWNSFETGSPDAPMRLTVGSASVPLEEVRRLARLAAKWSKGEAVTLAEQNELEEFIQSNDMQALAADQAEALGFTLAQLDGTAPPTVEQLVRLHDYLDDLDSWVDSLVDSFTTSKHTRSLTVVDIVYRKVEKKEREGYSGKRASLQDQIEAIRKQGSREADMVAATVRHGASTLTCLAYAISEMYSSVISLARDNLTRHWASGDAARGKALLATAHREKSDAKYNLLAIYRCVITRDQYSAVIESSDDHTGFDTDDYLTNDKDDKYDNTGFVIEKNAAGSPDGLDFLMGRGVSLMDKVGSIEFALRPPGEESSPFRNIADKAIVEASRIHKFESAGKDSLGRAMTRSVKRFRESFGS